MLEAEASSHRTSNYVDFARAAKPVGVHKVRRARAFEHNYVDFAKAAKPNEKCTAQVL